MVAPRRCRGIVIRISGISSSLMPAGVTTRCHTGSGFAANSDAISNARTATRPAEVRAGWCGRAADSARPSARARADARARPARTPRRRPSTSNDSLLVGPRRRNPARIAAGSAALLGRLGRLLVGDRRLVRALERERDLLDLFENLPRGAQRVGRGVDRAGDDRWHQRADPACRGLADARTLRSAGAPPRPARAGSSRPGAALLGSRLRPRRRSAGTCRSSPDSVVRSSIAWTGASSASTTRRRCSSRSISCCASTARRALASCCSAHMVSIAVRTSARLTAIAVSASSSARSRSARAAAPRSWLVSPRRSFSSNGSRASSAKNASVTAHTTSAPALASVTACIATQRAPRPRSAAAIAASRDCVTDCCAPAICASSAGVCRSRAATALSNSR